MQFKSLLAEKEKLVEESKAHTENVRKNHPEAFAERQRMDEVINSEYPFSFEILTFNPSTGMFIAKGSDHLGDSGLVGEINNGSIRFMKIYAGDLK